MLVRPEDIQLLAGLGGRPFEELLFDLIVMEASRHGISLGDIHWDHRTNIGDGGRDIIVDAEHSTPTPRFIPQRRSIWSAKSGKDGSQAATLRRELLDPSHPEIREHLQAGNPYVWCTLQPMSEDDRSALRETVRAVATDPNAFVFNPALVEFRGLTTLCNVLNDNPGLIPGHLPHVARVFGGVFSLAEWESQDHAGFTTPFVDFAARSQVVAQIRAHLRGRSEPNVLHVAGLSGVGKTRTVLEACRGQRELGGVLYVPRHADFADSLLRHLTRNENLLAIVVVDEMALEDLRTFTSQVGGFSHRLRFVTIGPARRNERGRSSANILILPEPETRTGVFEVVRQVGAGIRESVLESIARFAAHDLRLALMLVEATKQDGTFRDLPIEDGEEVWRRVTNLFRFRLGNLEAFRSHYPYLTVAIDIGVQGELRNELQEVAKQFNIDVERLDEAIASATPCGLGLRTTTFFESSPRALAGHLFRQRIWNSLQPRLPTFLGTLPDRLLRRFVERCQDCAGPERAEMEAALADFFRNELGPPGVTQLVDRGRSRLFKAWAELDPIRGLEWLRQATEHASHKELAALDGDPDGSGGWRGRRQVVWLCENLVCFGEHFADCESILFRLTLHETEPSIGNNSTSIWQNLFRPILAGTEVPFDQRLPILMRRLRAATIDELPLVLGAVLGVVEAPGFRWEPPAVVGGRLVPPQWKPKTWNELHSLQRAAGSQFLDAIFQLEDQRRFVALRFVVDNLGVFLRNGLLQHFRLVLRPEQMDDALRRRLVVQLEQQIGFSTLRDRDNRSDPTLHSLQEWLANLTPSSLASRARDLTAQDHWRPPVTDERIGRYDRLADELIASPETFRGLMD